MTSAKRRGFARWPSTPRPTSTSWTSQPRTTRTASNWECVPGWYWWGWYYYWDSCAWLRPVDVTYTVGSVLMLVIDDDIEPDEDATGEASSLLAFPCAGVAIERFGAVPSLAVGWLGKFGDELP